MTWNPTLLGIVCQCAALTASPLLSASHAVDFADRSVIAQRQFPPPQVQRYVSEIVRRYDADGDGQLQAGEWRPMRGQPKHIDHDGDGLLTHEEILQHVSQYAVGRRLGPPRDEVVPQQPAHPAPDTRALGSSADTSPPDTKPYFVPDRFLPQGLPDWFRARDANGDAQLSLAEFAPTGEAQLAAQFERSDAHRDGLITPAEAIRGAGGVVAGATTGRPPRAERGAIAASTPSGAQ
jgi:hypothetical protein